MATRTKYAATITTPPVEGDRSTTTETTQAWNSAIRKTEEMVRAYARATGERYVGGDTLVSREGDITARPVKPASPGAIYRRIWTGERSGKRIRAVVHELG